MTAFRRSSFETLHPLQRDLLRLYSLGVLFLGRCDRSLCHSLPVFSTFFSFVFILFFSGITVALATGSKPGISTDPVPSELKLDGGGEGESVRVVYVNKEVNAHL